MKGEEGSQFSFCMTDKLGVGGGPSNKVVESLAWACRALHAHNFMTLTLFPAMGLQLLISPSMFPNREIR